MKIQFDIPPSSASESNGVAVRYATAKRQVPRWRWYLLLGTVLAVPVYLSVRFLSAFLWASMPAQVMLEQATVRAPVAGAITALVPVGTELRAGYVLAELDASLPRDATTAETVASAPSSAGVAQAQAARVALLLEAERLARNRLEIQQERLRVMQGLYAQGAATRQEVDNLRFQELQAQADLSRARADVREYQAVRERERAQTSVAAPVTSARSNGLHVILAPFDSMVHRTVVHKGDWVVQGAEIAVVQSKTEPLVYAYVPPDKERYAQVGKAATLRFMDGTKVPAKVVRVMPEAQSSPLERSAPLAPHTPAIVVCLQSLQPLPAAYRIHQLPLEVRFDWVAGALW